MNAVVIALHDGGFDMQSALFPDLAADPAIASRLIGGPVPKAFRVPVWAFAIKTTEGWVLVDTGGGMLMGPGFGGVAGALSQAGIAAAQIGRVYLTHLHGDHCGGLLTADGEAAFPAARLALSMAELDCWTSVPVPAPMADIARDAIRALAPYAGRIDAAHSGTRIGTARAIDAAGHTPGHMAWAFENAGVIAVGDILHLPQVQISQPGWGCVWDMDPVAATATRHRIIAMARQSGAALLCGHAGRVALGVSPADGAAQDG